MGVDLELYFGHHLVGTVSKVFYSDLNWYGTLRLAAEVAQRLREFIAFSEDWLARADTGCPDEAEFAPWHDIYNSEDWQTLAPDGALCRITCPAFGVGGQLVWREA